MESRGGLAVLMELGKDVRGGAVGPFPLSRPEARARAAPPPRASPETLFPKRARRATRRIASEGSKCATRLAWSVFASRRVGCMQHARVGTTTDLDTVRDRVPRLSPAAKAGGGRGCCCSQRVAPWPARRRAPMATRAGAATTPPVPPPAGTAQVHLLSGARSQQQVFHDSLPVVCDCTAAARAAPRAACLPRPLHTLGPPPRPRDDALDACWRAPNPHPRRLSIAPCGRARRT